MIFLCLSIFLGITINGSTTFEIEKHLPWVDQPLLLCQAFLPRLPEQPRRILDTTGIQPDFSLGKDVTFVGANLSEPNFERLDEPLLGPFWAPRTANHGLRA